MTEQHVKSHSTRTLAEWLCYLESIHHQEIDMGLERISKVAKRLKIELSQSTVITVAGTNGKGTTCAFLENALLSQHRTVAVYSSPHIEKFNERLRVNRQDITNQPLVDAFEKIEQARADISLTYYEYTTLAALLILQELQPQYVILEVGLGGRLDATNIIDADIAVLTTIDLDHQAFLGNDRESIGFEKAGIMRPQQLAVLGDSNPPDSVLNHAKTLDVKLHCRGQHFNIISTQETWGWTSENNKFEQLPFPSIPVDNIATALMVLKLLDIQLTQAQCQQLVANTQVAGRTEIIQHSPCKVMVDVGHNPLAARYLAATIKKMNVGRVHAVVAMLADKDIANTIAPLTQVVDSWYCAGLDVARGASKEQMLGFLSEQDIGATSFDTVTDAYKMALSNASDNDLVFVFGSFFTVAQVKALIA